MLTRDKILNRKSGRFEVVAVPEWGGDVNIKALCVRDRAIIEADFVRLHRLIKSQDDSSVSHLTKLKLQMVALSVVDADGVAQFTLDDVELLAQQEPEAIGAIADAATLLNGFASKAVEDAAKN